MAIMPLQNHNLISTMSSRASFASKEKSRNSSPPHIYMQYIYIYIYIYIHIYTHTHTYIYIYIYIYTHNSINLQRRSRRYTTRPCLFNAILVLDPGYAGCPGVRGYYIQGTRVLDPGYEGIRSGVRGY